MHRERLSLRHFNPLFPYGKRHRQRRFRLVGCHISIHSSHTGRDYKNTCATSCASISIHSSHTGRDITRREKTMSRTISIHSSHTGRDRGRKTESGGRQKFQSTLPIREETSMGESTRTPSRKISIHSSHTGRDASTRTRLRRRPNFNPLFPYGKRQYYGDLLP